MSKVFNIIQQRLLWLLGMSLYCVIGVVYQSVQTVELVVVLTSSVELCFRLISPVDCPCLYMLVVNKSCDLWVPRCGLCGPYFPKNVFFLVHIFLIWVTNLKMATMLLGSPHLLCGCLLVAFFSRGEGMSPSSWSPSIRSTVEKISH